MLSCIGVHKYCCHVLLPSIAVFKIRLVFVSRYVFKYFELVCSCNNM
jgi:hypothetical protein